MFRTLFKLVVVGTVAALIWGFFHPRPAHPADAPPTSSVEPTSTTVPCPPPAHTDEGAARAIHEALDQLTQANMGRAPIDATVDKYVDPDAAAAERDYLKSNPAPFTQSESTVLTWQVYAFTPDTATIRLATSDTATAPDGTLTVGQFVTDAIVKWNAPAGRWRLAVWRITDVLNATQQLDNPRTLCDA